MALLGMPPNIAQRPVHVEAAQAYLARLRESSRRPQWQALRLISSKLWPERDPLLGSYSLETPELANDAT